MAPTFEDVFYAIFNAVNEAAEVNSKRKSGPIADVIFNDPATVIFWTDGTKTVVKRGENEPYDPEKGMAMAIAKKFIGDGDTHGNYYEIFKKYLPEDYTAKKEACEAHECESKQTADTIDKLETKVHNLELYLNKAWNRLSVRARKKMMDDFDGMPGFIRKDEFDIVADDDE